MTNDHPFTVQARVAADRSTGDIRACRKMITGPGVNEHPPYPGCTGFVGWESVTRLASGSLLCAFFVIDNWYGYDQPPPGRNKNSRVASIRSEDGGRSWRFLSRLKASVNSLDEPAITRAKDGRIVMIARPDGEIAFSGDNAATWTPPQAFGIKMVSPCLLTMKDGTIVCIFGWGATGGVQMMWSDDDSQTWTTPAADRGFTIDPSVYVYAIGCEMPDGSIYIVYYDPANQQTRTAIWSVRVKIREDRQGIDILPVE